jgi:hypothetical protein
MDPSKSSVKLVEPVTVEAPEDPKAREKIRVPVTKRSALVQGEGRSMGMVID